MLCFYESCSLETLRNAFVVLQEWKVIKLAKGTGDKRSQTFVSMTSPFTVTILHAHHPHPTLLASAHLWVLYDD
jgi:DNA-binding GntR family transcriptional regulator